MGAAYYRGFNVAEVDTDGFVQPVVSIDLDVYNITQVTSIGTVSVDASGIVAEGSFGAATGDVVEFSHGSYPLKFRQTLTATPDEAYLHPSNNVVTYILENSYASTAVVETAEIYAQDLDDMGQRPVLLGTVKAGETTKIPFQSSVAKNLRLMLVSRDSSGAQTTSEFAYAESEDVSVAALAPGTVTSVAMSVPSALLSVSGSPITTTGTFAVSLVSQSANRVFASPNGSSGTPSFRALVAADLPTTGLTGVYSYGNFGLNDNDNSHKLTVRWAENSAADRILSLLVNGSNRQISLSGDLTVSGAATVSGTNTGDTIVVGTTPLGSGTNGRVLYQSGGVVTQGTLGFNGTDLEMIGGGNLILTAGYLQQRSNGRNWWYNWTNGNYSQIWNPSTTGAATLNIFDGTGTGIHLDGGGNISIGHTSPAVKFHVRSTSTPQFQVDYDASNKRTTSVSSSGVVTEDITGSNAKTVFNDPVEIPYGIFGNITDDGFDTAFNNAPGAIVSLNSAGGFKFDTSFNPKAQIGDHSVLGNGTCITVEDASQQIYRNVGTGGQMAQIGGKLFQHFVDETTGSNSQENLYTYTLPAGSLTANGDTIRCEYGGIFTANTNTKRIFPKFAGVILATGQVSAAAATDWTIDFSIIRVSNTVVRFMVEFTATGEAPIIESGEITGLNLTSTAYDIDLDGRSVSSAGELTAHSGHAVYHPAAA